MSYSIFSVYGVELEYMIVDRDSLAVRPDCALILADEAGSEVADVERGSMSWSNELTAHVIEFKTTEPVSLLEGLDRAFQGEVQRANELAGRRGAMLLPTAMHPFMDPTTETVLWEHERNEIYHAFDRIFGCEGHGWANLQSTHINLPFEGDDEFARLHSAIRVVLPLLPALAASSPVVEGRITGRLDNRMSYYRSNSRRIPSITAAVVPEPVLSRQTYETDILQRIYNDIAPHDPEGILQHEWLNARGAIARFDRGAIEIRVLDVQECPAADLAILEFIVAVLRGLDDGVWCDPADLARVPTEPLAEVLDRTTADAEKTHIASSELLGVFGASGPMSARDLLGKMLADVSGITPESRDLLMRILESGSLATRIVAELGEEPDHDRIVETYGRLARCLEAGTLFNA